MINEQITLKKEIMPLYSTLLVEMYETNPYEVAETETGLKLTNGTFDSPDTGNREKKEFLSSCGKVIEVGPDCKYVEPGNDVIFDIRATRPLCFKGKYFFNIAEQNIIAVLGDDLSKKFNKNGN